MLACYFFLQTLCDSLVLRPAHARAAGRLRLVAVRELFAACHLPFDTQDLVNIGLEESRPPEGRPEDSSIYIYIYIYTNRHLRLPGDLIEN